MNKSKVAIVVSQVKGFAQFWCGTGLSVLFSLCSVYGLVEIIGGDTADVDFTIVSVILLLLGLFLISLSKKTKKLIAEFKKYVSVISVERIDSINQLASTVGESPEIVKGNLEKMIKRNYFVNAYINYENDTLVIANANVLNYNLKQEINEGEYDLCNCKKCGAVSKIKVGAMAVCDYCGSPIK